ncbi:hypothetical protein BRC90_01850 [Halobacteriales archaeon QS_4_69_34]|nr:MAG: hypothetical protein BRC90_01850 [Halobacteriales archaeon QS_4_69_34]
MKAPAGEIPEGAEDREYDDDEDWDDEVWGTEGWESGEGKSWSNGHPANLNGVDATDNRSSNNHALGRDGHETDTEADTDAKADSTDGSSDH